MRSLPILIIVYVFVFRKIDLVAKVGKWKANIIEIVFACVCGVISVFIDALG